MEPAMSLFSRTPHIQPTLAGRLSNPTSPRRKRVVGNWKMYGNLALCRQAVPLLAEIATADVDLVLCPPAPYLGEVARLAHGSHLQYCSQNVAELADGARTGEWSAHMLADLGCHYAIVGHSERRLHHHENDVLIAAKAKACVQAGITPIVCIGENWVQRQTGQTEAVLQYQLGTLLESGAWQGAIIAYEPVWAIGTGIAATPEEAQAAHRFIREQIAAHGVAAAAAITLLYGGSVNADNAAALFAMPDIDGGLVGGASLDTGAFLRIYAAAQAADTAIHPAVVAGALQYPGQSR